MHGLRRAGLLGGTRRDGLASIDESTLVSIVDTAAAIAAITCSRPGADPPTRAEFEAARTTMKARQVAVVPAITPR